MEELFHFHITLVTAIFSIGFAVGYLNGISTGRLLDEEEDPEKKNKEK